MKQFHFRYLMIVTYFMTIWMRLEGQPIVSHSTTIESSTEKARENLLLLLSGEWVSRALYVVTKLEIADYLQEGWKLLKKI
jgi:hypothetical protein